MRFLGFINVHERQALSGLASFKQTHREQGLPRTTMR